MKIVYLSKSSIISDTANSVHVMKMCHALARLQHDVTLFAMAGAGSEDDAFAYYGVEPKFLIRRFDEESVAVNRMLLAMRRRLAIVKIGSVPSLIFGQRVLRQLVLRIAPDLVYARNRDWLLALPADVPFVYESHYPAYGGFARFAERKLFRRSGFRNLVVISQRLRQNYLDYFPELHERIIVAHDAADDPPPIEPLPRKSGFHVGYVGHLYDGRGIDLICGIARRLPTATFHLVGGTQHDVRRLLNQPGLPKNLIVHGHKSPSSLAIFYRQFDVVMAPYQRSVAVAGNVNDSSEFMSPLKIFEYMAAGKPILCSDLPVLREVLKNDHNSILLPPDDVDRWTAAVGSLMHDAERRRRLGETARADFLAQHTWLERARLVLNEIRSTETSDGGPI